MTKKKEFNEAKIKTQAELMLPTELKDVALKAWEKCKGVCKSPATYDFLIHEQIKFNESIFFLNLQQKITRIPVIVFIIRSNATMSSIHRILSSLKLYKLYPLIFIYCEDEKKRQINNLFSIVV